MEQLTFSRAILLLAAHVVGGLFILENFCPLPPDADPTHGRLFSWIGSMTALAENISLPLAAMHRLATKQHLRYSSSIVPR